MVSCSSNSNLVITNRPSTELPLKAKITRSVEYHNILHMPMLNFSCEAILKGVNKRTACLIRQCENHYILSFKREEKFHHFRISRGTSLGLVKNSRGRDEDLLNFIARKELGLTKYIAIPNPITSPISPKPGIYSSWFHSGLNRNQAEEILKEHSNVFIFRPSSSEPGIVLSFRVSDGEVNHRIFARGQQPDTIRRNGDDVDYTLDKMLATEYPEFFLAGTIRKPLIVMQIEQPKPGSLIPSGSIQSIPNANQNLTQVLPNDILKHIISYLNTSDSSAVAQTSLKLSKITTLTPEKQTAFVDGIINNLIREFSSETIPCENFLRLRAVNKLQDFRERFHPTNSISGRLFKEMLPELKRKIAKCLSVLPASELCVTTSNKIINQILQRASNMSVSLHKDIKLTN